MAALSAEEAESSASSASADRLSAVLPIVAFPEDSSPGSHERRNPFQDLKMCNIYLINI
jgi:hypothetical protein